MWCANITASDYPEKALQVKKVERLYSDQILYFKYAIFRPRCFIASHTPFSPCSPCSDNPLGYLPEFQSDARRIKAKHKINASEIINFVYNVRKTP